MSNQPKLLGLARELAEATEREKVRWSETAAEDTFRVIFDTALVKIMKVEGLEDGTPALALVVATPTGKTVDEIGAVRGVDDDYETLDELFNLARSSALDSEKVIDQLRLKISKL